MSLDKHKTASFESSQFPKKKKNKLNNFNIV